MTPPRGIWHIEDLAAALGRPISWLHRVENREKYEAAGMPTPLPRIEQNERLRWYEDECRTWIETRRMGLRAPANDTEKPPAEDAARARMARKLASL